MYIFLIYFSPAQKHVIFEMAKNEKEIKRSEIFLSFLTKQLFRPN